MKAEDSFQQEKQSMNEEEMEMGSSRLLKKKKRIER
jgi:hypothetical protein